MVHCQRHLDVDGVQLVKLHARPLEGHIYTVPNMSTYFEALCRNEMLCPFLWTSCEQSTSTGRWRSKDLVPAGWMQRGHGGAGGEKLLLQHTWYPATTSICHGVYSCSSGSGWIVIRPSLLSQTDCTHALLAIAH